jgi:predicted amidophosphoribosyltransferase
VKKEYDLSNMKKVRTCKGCKRPVKSHEGSYCNVCMREAVAEKEKNRPKS